MKLSIVVPFSTELFSLKDLKDTVDSFFADENLTFSIYSRQKLDCKNCEVKNIDFKNIYSAYNKAIKTEKADYIWFILPGDVINKKEVQDLRFEENVIQFLHSRKNNDGTVYSREKFLPEPGVCCGLDRIPKNMSIVYDKIYRIDFLRENQIFFKNHEDAALFFNIKCYTLSDIHCKKTCLVTHKIKSKKGELKDDPKYALRILKEIQTEKACLLDFINNLKKLYKEKLERGSIDFVFPFVTSEDPYWQSLYKEYLKGTETDWAAGIERFRDNGMLKYLFRSLDNYLPWINKVHMIVMSESQVPKWINRKYVNIITHDQFIPKEFLPTFNSTTIEMFLPFLPNVANNFIYSNDDLITFKPLQKDYFFNFKGIPVYNISLRDFKSTAPGDVIRRNVYNQILKQNQSKRIVTTQHGTISYKKDWILNCFEENKSEILKSCSKFREEKNFNQYIYAFYQMWNNEIVNSEKNIISFTVKDSQIYKILNDDFSNYDFICLNDDNFSTDIFWKKILQKLDILLPNKSKYEV